jgi:hypothetical protein
VKNNSDEACEALRAKGFLCGTIMPTAINNNNINNIN